MASAACAAIGPAAQAQVQTDGSLGPVRTLAGPNMLVTPDLGQQRGGNLFHSFRHLNVNTGQSLTFTGPTSVRNVLARVTGGEMTRINGRLACDIPSANLYLMNPAGILWGPGAELDISGSLVMTSSDLIRFSDGGRFAATPGGDDLLTSAPVSAFGFLKPQSAAGGVGIVGDAATPQTATLRMPPGQTLSLIGGQIGLALALVFAEGGRINLVAAGQGGEVVGDGVNPAAEPKVTGPRSNLLVTVFSVVQSDGRADGTAPNGPISVIANEALITLGAQLNGFNNSALPGGEIRISTTGLLSIEDNGKVQSGAFASGPGGNLTIDAGRLAITELDIDDDFTSISSLSNVPQTFAGRIVVNASQIEMSGGRAQIGTGFGGPSPGIEINAGELRLAEGARIASTSLGVQRLGDVLLNLNTLKLTEASSIFCRGIGGETGGTVRIQARDRIELSGDSVIFGNVLTPATDEGGVRMQTRHLVARARATINAEAFEVGGAGPIVIRAVDVKFLDASSIRSSTASGDAAGRIDVRARRILLDGRGGFPDPNSADGLSQVSVRSNTGSVVFGEMPTPGGGAGGTVRLMADESIIITGGASVDATSRPGGGPGGLVVAEAPLIRISGGAVLSAANVGNVPGSSAGAVHLKADRIEISGDRSGIRTLTTVAPDLPNAGPGGKGGDAVLTARHLTLQDSAVISASTRSAGDGGSVTVEADRVELSGGALISASTVSDEVGTATGKGGSVQMRGSTLRITDPDTRISAETVTDTPGGSIRLDFSRIEIDGGPVPADSTVRPAGVSVRTTAGGAGGAIEISVSDMLTLRNFSAITAESTSGSVNAGDAGVIRITSGDSVNVLDGARIGAQAAGANGGDIRLDAGRRLLIQDLRPGAFAPSPESAQADTFPGPRITARAAGNGGNISLAATDLVFLRRGLITAQTGNVGGQITIDPEAVVIDKSLIDGRSGGTPVPVSIVTDGLLLSDDSLILTDAPAFTVNTDIAGTIAAIDARVVDATQRLIESCGQRFQADGDFSSTAGFSAISSFIVEGRGGLPLVPGEPLPLVLPPRTSPIPATQPAP
ncbi:MAG: filamentous hemagglutinin N-terminal domain-containing protein [Phycisphaerales bacterium]|nr:filamentous hemagglutinin N-terminal domain-containing protein [Phycisphaerales bacterium]